MSARSSHLALAPERCDGCGRCVPTCARGALRVGGGYVYVDASDCEACGRCVEVCSRGALTMRSGTGLTAVTGPGGAKVVVGSRAEAKALRARDAQKERSAARPKAPPRERIPSAGGVAWTMLDAGVVLTVMLASLAATNTIASSQFIRVMPPSGQAAARSAMLVGFFAVQMVTMGVLARRHGSKLDEAFGLKKAGAGPKAAIVTSLLVVALTFGTRAASYLWGVVARAAGWSPPDSSALTSVFGAGGWGLMLAVIALVVLGPISEELVFRGVLLGAFELKWGPWPAILGTAALFAAYHVTAWTVVPLFLLGSVLGWLAWSRRSLKGAIALHALYNGVVVAAAYWLAR